jgi:enoyl-CoA hydratase/carnithine racemase
VTAREAFDIGLVHKLVAKSSADESDHGELYSQVRLWAREIASAAPLSLKQAKAAIDGGYDKDLATALAWETKCYLQLINTKDRLEGLAAFAEKREPVYKGE